MNQTKKIKNLEFDRKEKAIQYENMKISELNNLKIISACEKELNGKVVELDIALKNCVKCEKEVNKEKEKTKYLEQIILENKMLEEKIK